MSVFLLIFGGAGQERSLGWQDGRFPLADVESLYLRVRGLLGREDAEARVFSVHFATPFSTIFVNFVNRAIFLLFLQRTLQCARK